jgi:hypothetical protein
MRYGLGQLADYAYRYRSDFGIPIRLLAFGRPPEKDASWVAGVLEDANVAFVAADGDRLVPLNDSARSISILR